MVGFRLRLLLPVILIALSLITICTITAVSLFNEQATVTRVLRENVESRRAAVELEECLTDLVALENNRIESVSVLHDRVRVLTQAVADSADQPEERQLYEAMQTGFARYLARWQGMPEPGTPGHDAARREATRVLENDVLKPCQDFEQYNARRIEASTEHHERILRQVAWGMALIGGLGAVAGIVLGFGVSRGLSQSIRRLHVQIRDAAGKLGTPVPEIVLTGEFHGLHAEVDKLSERIEEVVSTLQQREHEVLRAEQLAAVGQLAAGVAHEIRNPMTSVKMLVQAGLADGDTLTPEDLRIIEGEVRRVEKSLQTFLDFARPPKPDRRPTDLAAVLRGVVELIRGRAEKQRVQLELDLPPYDASLVADGEQLRQVFVNVCLNALDVMPSGGKLRISLHETAARRLQVEIADTGPGIARNIAPRLFEPFVSSKDTGLGLGLVISRRVVEDHGGTIAAANRRDGGASFFIALPATNPVPVVEAAHAELAHR
jgi:signal transduction histidine kinase